MASLKMRNRLLCYSCSLLLLLLALPGHRARAQAAASPADSGARATTASRLTQRYAASRGYEARLYDGPEYVAYVKSYVQGHPFFESAAARPATIVYDGATYPNVPLRYDLVRGQLVLAHPPSGLELRLVNEKVARFSVGGHTFVRLVADSTAGADSPIRTGFYDILVEGQGLRLLASRRKNVQERNAAEGKVGEVSQKNDYFLQQNARYYPVTSAKEVTRLFPASKAALRQFARTQKLTFRGASREPSLVALTQYLTTLPRPGGGGVGHLIP